jgi:ABC-type nickel/cobalt efflux system permease component RcnA
MKSEPIMLAIAIPLLMGLGLLCLVRRHRQKFEQEKKWEKSKKKYRHKDWRY